MSDAAGLGGGGENDVDEFTRTYSRRDGWRGATGLAVTMLTKRLIAAVSAGSPGLYGESPRQPGAADDGQR